MRPAATGFWYFGFLLSGVLTTLLGPILPQLSSAWHLSDPQAGLLFAAQFLGSLGGSLAGGHVAARISAKPVVGTGFLLCASGLVLAALEIWPLGAVGVALWGVGLGLVIPLVNVTVAAVHPQRRAEALNLLNFVWGFGAVTSGPMVAAVVRFGLRPLLLTLAAILLATASGVFLSVVETQQQRISVAAERSSGRLTLILWTGLFLFLYVGVENGLSGWLPTYMTRELGSLSGAVWAQAGFWTALLAGRLAAPMLLRGGNSRVLLLAGLVVAAGGFGLLITLHEEGAAVSGACVAGLGLSAVFPTAVALFTEKAGLIGTRVTGIVFSMAALGGVTLPWLVGVASLQLGSVRWALVAPWLCVFGMVAVTALVNPWREESA